MKDNYKIYVHVNKANGKMYIGQTKQEPNNRWMNGAGYKNNKHFWSAIQQYGWNNFDHLVICENLSLEEANLIEDELIKKYNTLNNKLGYNLRNGGRNGHLTSETKKKIGIANRKALRGRSLSEETKKKISKATKGKNNPFYNQKHTLETKEKMSKNKRGKHQRGNNYFAKEVNQYDLNGIYIRSFDCMQDAIEQTSCYNISNVCHLTAFQSGGYIWRFTTDYKKFENLPEREVLKVKEKSQKGKYHPQVKPVAQYCKDELICIYWGATEAANVTGIKRTYITKCCLGKQKTAGGFRWEYYNKEIQE